MAPLWIIVVAGIVAGLVASGVMNLYQSIAGSAFGQDQSDDDPSTVKAADTAKEAVAGEPVEQSHRRAAGSLVHYATGAVLGAGYALLVAGWPGAASGFGIFFGLVLAIVLDDFLVPLFGWGPWPTRAGAASQLYSLTSHVVFGLALEAVRRLALSILA